MSKTDERSERSTERNLSIDWKKCFYYLIDVLQDLDVVVLFNTDQIGEDPNFRELSLMVKTRVPNKQNRVKKIQWTENVKS